MKLPDRYRVALMTLPLLASLFVQGSGGGREKSTSW